MFHTCNKNIFTIKMVRLRPRGPARGTRAAKDAQGYANRPAKVERNYSGGGELPKVWGRVADSLTHVRE